MKLGVFDSGIGGRAVARSLEHIFSDAIIEVVDDHEHVPYGDRSQDDVRKLTDAAIQPLLAGNCDIIILACNTATAAAIEFLREKYPQQKFIGLEPMVKPAAALTKTGIIAVCATPATLQSKRYQNLKQRFAAGVAILEPDCSSWARMIEDSTVNETHVKETINAVIENGADVIVLACTHYHWIRELIEQTAAGRARILDPTAAVANRIKNLLQR